MVRINPSIRFGSAIKLVDQKEFNAIKDRLNFTYEPFPGITLEDLNRDPDIQQRFYLEPNIHNYTGKINKTCREICC